MRMNILLFPIFLSAIVAVLVGNSLSNGNMFGAYVALAVGTALVATTYMSCDAKTDERDFYNASRAALATLRTILTIGIVIGAWLAASGHPEGTSVALFSVFSAIIWFVLYLYYSWRDIK